MNFAADRDFTPRASGAEEGGQLNVSQTRPLGLNPAEILNQSPGEVAEAVVRGMAAFQPQRSERDRVIPIQAYVERELLDAPHIHAATPAQLLKLALTQKDGGSVSAAQRYDLPFIRGKEGAISDVIAACTELSHSSCPSKMILLYGPRGDNKEQVLKYLATKLERFLGQGSEHPLRNLAYQVSAPERRTSGFHQHAVQDGSEFIIPELGGAPAFSFISNESPGSAEKSQREILLMRLNARVDQLKEEGVVPPDFELSAEHFLRNLQGPRMRLLNMAFAASQVNPEEFARGFVAQERPFDRRAGQGLVWITPNSDPTATLVKFFGEGTKGPGNVMIPPWAAGFSGMLPAWLTGILDKLDTVQSPWIDSNNGVAFVTDVSQHLPVVAGILDSKELSFRTGSGNVVIPYAGLIVACVDSEVLERLDYETLERLKTYSIPVAVGNCSDFIGQAARLRESLSPRTGFGRHALPLFGLAVAATGILETDTSDADFPLGSEGELLRSALTKLSPVQKVLLYCDQYLSDYPRVADSFLREVQAEGKDVGAPEFVHAWSLDRALDLESEGLKYPTLSESEKAIILSYRDKISQQHHRRGELAPLGEFLFGISDQRAEELTRRLASKHADHISMIDVIDYLEELQAIGLTSHSKFLQRKEATRKQLLAELEQREGGSEDKAASIKRLEQHLERQYPIPDPRSNLELVYRVAREWLLHDLGTVLGLDFETLKLGSESRRNFLSELRADVNHYASAEGDFEADLHTDPPAPRAQRINRIIEGFTRLGYSVNRVADYLEFATRPIEASATERNPV